MRWRDPFFREYVQQTKWKSLARPLIGEEACARVPDWFDKPPGSNHYHCTLPHQDNYYLNLQPCNVVTIWMALDPVDGENGVGNYSIKDDSRQSVTPRKLDGNQRQRFAGVT